MNYFAIGFLIGVQMAFGPSVVCPECGVNVPKAAFNLHACNVETLVKHQMSVFKQRVSRGVETDLTPRQKRQIEFYRWCAEHNRL